MTNTQKDHASFNTIELIAETLNQDLNLVLKFKVLYPEIFHCPTRDLAGAWVMGINCLDNVIPECKPDLIKRLAYIRFRMYIHGMVN